MNTTGQFGLEHYITYDKKWVTATQLTQVSCPLLKMKWIPRLRTLHSSKLTTGANASKQSFWQTTYWSDIVLRLNAADRKGFGSGSSVSRRTRTHSRVLLDCRTASTTACMYWPSTNVAAESTGSDDHPCFSSTNRNASFTASTSRIRPLRCGIGISARASLLELPEPPDVADWDDFGSRTFAMSRWSVSSLSWSCRWPNRSEPRTARRPLVPHTTTCNHSQWHYQAR